MGVTDLYVISNGKRSDISLSQDLTKNETYYCRVCDDQVILVFKKNNTAHGRHRTVKNCNGVKKGISIDSNRKEIKWGKNIIFKGCSKSSKNIRPPLLSHPWHEITGKTIEKVKGNISQAKLDNIKKLKGKKLSSKKELEKKLSNAGLNKNEISQIAKNTIPDHVFYNITDYEKYIIDLLMEKTRQGGYKSAKLPKIYLSFEKPPIFLSDPRLEKDYIPDFLPIEELLGCYIPGLKIVILYDIGLEWYSIKRNINKDCLRAVVLVHEIAHWISHLLPKRGITKWPLEFYNDTDINVHEGWAQLLTYWVVKEEGGDIKNTFQKLNTNQPAPYKIYENFTKYWIEEIMDSLAHLRTLGRPAKLQDWQAVL
jgi:hypothetical protein